MNPNMNANPNILGNIQFGYQGGRDRRDRKSGYGVMIFPTGAIYRGYFKKDKMEGHGIYQWGDGNVYEGEFKDGKQSGVGTYTWPTGGRYYGYWVDDKMSGKGVYVRQDGVIYEGFWKDDHQYGPGIKKIPEKIAFGKKKEMLSERIIREFWVSKKKTAYQIEPYKIPKMKRECNYDIVIKTRDEDDDVDMDDEDLMDVDTYEENDFLNFMKKNMSKFGSTSTAPKIKKAQPNLCEMKSGNIMNFFSKFNK